jgi:hypothetical protein
MMDERGKLRGRGPSPQNIDLGLAYSGSSCATVQVWVYETWKQLSTLTVTSSHNRVIHDMGEVLAGREIRTRT